MQLATKKDINSRLQFGDRDRIALLTGFSRRYVYGVMQGQFSNTKIEEYAWLAVYDRITFDEAYHKERLRLSELAQQQPAAPAPAPATTHKHNAA
jgi:hypothetical protein